MRHLFLLLALLFTFSLHASPPKGDKLVVVEQSGRVEFYDTSSHQRLGGTAVNDLPHEITLSEDGNTAYVTNFGLQDYDETIGTPGDTISIIDTHSFKVLGTLSTGLNNAPHGIKVRPQHPDELYVNTEMDDKIIVFDLKTKTIKKEFTATAGTHNFIFSPNGKMLWLMAAANGVTKVDAESGVILGNFYTDSPIRGIQYTPDGLIMASSTNRIDFFDPASLKTVRTLDDLGVDQILYSAISPDNHYIVAPAVWNNETLIINNHTGKILKRMVTGLDPVNVVIDKQSQYAYVSNARNSHVTQINLRSLTSEDIDVQPGPNGLALLPLSEEVGETHRLPQFILGALLPLTGEEKRLGREMMTGFEFFRDTINHLGGLKIGQETYQLKIAYEDTQSDPSGLKSKFEQLRRDNKLNGLLLTDDAQANTILNDTGLPVYPLIAPQDNYQNEDKALFSPFQSEEGLFQAYQNQLNLSMTTLSERAFLSTKLAQRTVVDNLYLPTNQNKAPGIVLLHASGGIEKNHRAWAEQLREWGYAVLIVDSFTVRGYLDRKSIGWDKAYQAQLADLPNAFRILAQQKNVAANNMGLLGFSLGGYSTLVAMQKEYDLPFSWGASFYGHAYRFTPGTAFKKTVIFNGKDDDRSPLAGAQALQQGEPQGNITLFSYAKAHHGFDNFELPQWVEMLDENGVIYHLGYNAIARDEAIKDFYTFLHSMPSS